MGAKVHPLFKALVLIVGIHSDQAQPSLNIAPLAQSIHYLLVCNGYKLRFAKQHQPNFDKLGVGQ
jgi:hypothetical protein